MLIRRFVRLCHIGLFKIVNFKEDWSFMDASDVIQWLLVGAIGWTIAGFLGGLCLGLVI